MKDFEPVAGRHYCDRKSGKKGMLLTGDSQKNTYTLVDDETNEEIVVNRTIFRNNWRVVENTPETTEPELDTTYQETDDCSAEQAFVNQLNDKRETSIEQPDSETCTLIVEGIPVLKITKSSYAGALNVKMVPDLYTYSNFLDTELAMSPKFDLRDKDRMTVKLVTVGATVLDILKVVSRAAGEINLYGYKN